MSHELVAIRDDNLYVLHESPKDPYRPEPQTAMTLMTARMLQQIVHDFRSWLNFIHMIRTGKPALMTVKMDNGKVSRIKVVQDCAFDATFETI